MEPKVLICDEATSSLDVTIQKQIMELLEETEGYMAYPLYLSAHNLALVQSFHGKVLVYDGKSGGEREAVMSSTGRKRHCLKKLFVLKYLVK